MNKTNFTAILQVALWKNDGMDELEIRQYLSKLVSPQTINAGLNLFRYLDSIQEISK